MDCFKALRCRTPLMLFRDDEPMPKRATAAGLSNPSRRALLGAGLGMAPILMLGGCSSMSRDGPAPETIRSDASYVVPAAPDLPVFNYVLLDITRAVVDIFGARPSSSLYDTFGRDKGPAPEIRVGVGDVVQLTVFESQAGGLFIPGEAGVRSGNFVTMPPEIIDRRGTLTVPYAGELKAVGQTIPQLQNAINDALKNRAIEPQTVISMVSRASTQATIVGDVRSPMTIEVGPKGQRVLDMIAKAGGIVHPGYETYITVQRGNRKATVYFDTILGSPRENIYIHPDDTVYAYWEPNRFLALGAVRTAGEFDFNAPSVTLVEAIGIANGLDDSRASPGDVYLYRSAPRGLLEEIGADLTRFPESQKTIPLIFRANFRDSASYFAAMKFLIADKDVIYVSNSRAYEFTKLLTLVNNTSNTLSTVPYNLVVARASAASLGMKASPITPYVP